MDFLINKMIFIQKQFFVKLIISFPFNNRIVDCLIFLRLIQFNNNYHLINFLSMLIKWYSNGKTNFNYFIQYYFRETKQATELLYKLLNGLSQPKIRMTPQQQLFCQQIVERVCFTTFLQQKSNLVLFFLNFSLKSLINKF